MNLEEKISSGANAVHLVDFGHLQVELLLDPVSVLERAAAGDADGLVDDAHDVIVAPHQGLSDIVEALLDLTRLELDEVKPGAFQDLEDGSVDLFATTVFSVDVVVVGVVHDATNRHCRVVGDLGQAPADVHGQELGVFQVPERNLAALRQLQRDGHSY